MSNNDNDFSSIFFQNVTPSSDGNNDQSVDTPSEDSNSAINNNAVNNANTDNFAAGNTSNDSAANYSSNNSSADNFNMNQNTQQSPYAPNNMGQQSDSAFDQNMNSNQAYTDPAYNMNQTLNQNQPFNNVPPEPVKKPKKKAIFISIAVA